MIAVLIPLAYMVLGGIVTAIVLDYRYRRAVIRNGRSARAPICNSCPYVTEAQRLEINTAPDPGTDNHPAVN